MEREAIKAPIVAYLEARGWKETIPCWWRKDGFPGDYVVWDAFHRQCDEDAPQIVAALKATGQL